MHYSHLMEILSILSRFYSGFTYTLKFVTKTFMEVPQYLFECNKMTEPLIKANL